MNSMLVKAIITGPVFLFALLLSSPASADLVVFDTTTASPSLADGLSNGDVVTSGGINMTFSNVVVADGSGTGDVEAAGILLSSTTDISNSDVLSFDFSFDQDFMITDYTIGLYEDVPVGSFFTISGPNGTSGNNLIPTGTGFTPMTLSFDAGTISVFQAGLTYSFVHNLPSTGDPLFDFAGFSNISTVPEPSTALILILGLVGVCHRRQRS